jgi:hypothetical protein
LHGAAFQRRPADDRTVARKDHRKAFALLVFGYVPLAAGKAVFAVLIAEDNRVVGAAQSAGSRHNSLQHRVEVESRAADDLEHL